MDKDKMANDLISRQAAIDAMIKIEQDDIDQYGCKIPEGFDCSPAIEALEGLPPVTPQPEMMRVTNIDFDEEKFKEICKNALLMILDDSNTPTIQSKTGRWIDIMVGDMPAQACDQCNTFYPLAYTGGGHNYCPKCGAKMESDNND